jgi:serine protease inhibitor
VAPGVTVGTTTSPVPELKLSLPSFAVEVEHDLLAQRELFGLSTVSTDPGRSGHFSAISPEPLVVGQAKQTVLARFFATGFEAAAVTAMGMMLTSMPTRQERRLDVDLNRPFAFVALHRATRLPIVAGWIAHPTEPA